MLHNMVMPDPKLSPDQEQAGYTEDVGYRISGLL